MQKSTITVPISSHSSDSENHTRKELQLAEIKKQCEDLKSQLKPGEKAEQIVKEHIKHLKEYNELKDIAMGLINVIADQRKCKLIEILQEMAIDINDN